MLINNLHLLQILCLIFLSILFLQSSIDKIYDWKGNIDFFKSHFSKTIAEIEIENFELVNINNFLRRIVFIDKKNK